MITVNGKTALTARLFIPWTGPWIASCTLDEPGPASGRVTLAVAGDTLLGTVDEERSGSFGEQHTLVAVGGHGGWSQRVRAQDFHSPIGVKLSSVVTATAAAVGESASVLDNETLGKHYARAAGPASRVLHGRPWWVGFDGITRVGKRPEIKAHESLLLASWDPDAQLAELTCDVLIEPGTRIVDERLPGPMVVAECELELSEAVVRATAILKPSAPEGSLASALGAELAEIARAAVPTQWLASYEYRVVATQGDKVTLQAVRPSDGTPDLMPVELQMGIPGASAMLTPGSQVMVGFTAGDPSRPRVEHYSGTPLQLKLDATLGIELCGPAALPVVRMTPAFAQWIGAITTAINTLLPGSATPPADIASLKVRSG